MRCPSCNAPHDPVGAKFCSACGRLVEPAADPMVGQVIGGRYRVTHLVAEGGMGRVYGAEQTMGGTLRKVAIKLLLAEYSGREQDMQRLARECSTVAELEHPNTIKFYDYGSTLEGDLFIAMEFLSGDSLSQIVKHGPMSPERVDLIMGQICGSLQEAHDRGIVHRDLKPDNIVLTSPGGAPDFVKVLDFGIAKRTGGREAKLTPLGVVLGSPPYMSPEQFTMQDVDHRSDIYSLGIVAYQMLTGQLPFVADDPIEWAALHMGAKPTPIDGHGVPIPPQMRMAVHRALAKEPSMRPQSMRDFYADFTIGAGSLEPHRLSSVFPLPSQMPLPSPAKLPSLSPGSPGESASNNSPAPFQGERAKRTGEPGSIEPGNWPTMDKIGASPDEPTGARPSTDRVSEEQPTFVRNPPSAQRSTKLGADRNSEEVPTNVRSPPSGQTRVSDYRVTAKPALSEPSGTKQGGFIAQADPDSAPDTTRQPDSAPNDLLFGGAEPAPESVTTVTSVPASAPSNPDTRRDPTSAPVDISFFELSPSQYPSTESGQEISGLHSPPQAPASAPVASSVRGAVAPERAAEAKSLLVETSVVRSSKGTVVMATPQPPKEEEAPTGGKFQATPQTIRDPVLIAQAMRKSKRRPLLWVAMGLVLLGAVASTVVWLVFLRPTQKPKPKPKPTTSVVAPPASSSPR